jgi:uncharacterized protein with beta-barrel porin domain
MSKSGRAAALLWAGVIVAVGLAWAGAARADSLALVSGSGQSGLIGQPGAQPIVVQARNVNGVAVAGRTIHWTTSNGFGLSATTSVTDANGNASIDFTYGNYGTTNIVASDPTGNTSANAIATSVGSDTLVVISGSGQAGQQGSTSTQPIVVELRNAAGVAISGRTINWSDQTTYTQVASSTSSTDAQGRASMNFTYLQGPGAVSGATAIIRATSSTGPYADASATVLGFDVVRLVSVQSQSGLVGSAGTPIVVRVTDWTGAIPRPGVTVTWYERLSSGLVSLSSSSTVTDANGQASIGFQYLLPGSGEISAEVGLSQVDMSFVSVGSDHMVLISPNNTYGAPGTPATAPIVVEVRNVYNQPIPGRTITWGIYFGDAVVDAPTSVTDANGQATMGFTHGTVLSAIGAHDLTIVNANPPQPNFAGDADTYSNPTNPVNQSRLRLVSGSGQTGAAGTAGAQPLVVEVVDGTGTPVVGLEVFFVVSGSVVLDPNPSLTDINGLASKTFTYGGPGQSMVEAHRNFGTPAGTAAYVQFHVTATGVDTIASISGDNQSGLPGSHSTQPLVAELRDAGGNPVVGRQITWIVNSGAASATFDGANSLTDANGQASMGFTYSAGASIAGLEARDMSTGVHIEFFATTVGADAVSIISGNGQSGPQGTAAPQPLVVEVRDPAGSPVVGRTINWNASGPVTLNGPSSITDGLGRASMGFDFGDGPATVTAEDPSSSKMAQFAVSGADVPFLAKIISGDGQAGLPGSDGAQPIVLEIRDANNNPSPGENVAWSVVSGPATLLTTQATTDANGHASATFNYGATPGTSIIQAKDPNNPNGQLIQATVTSLSDNQTLATTDGADQVLVVGTPSLPLVVQLKDFADQPVVGATIDWTASNGTLQNASSITDAQGNATNTVTATASGPVEVRANSQLAAAEAVFAFNSSLAALPNLTPEEAATAEAIDNACPALADKSTLTAEEADFLARCKELSTASTIDAHATAQALAELVSDTAQAQSTAAMAAVTAQVINVRSRLLALRSSSPTTSLSGLTLTAAGGTVSLPMIWNALGEDKPADASSVASSPWGFFATGNIGRGEQEEGRAGPAFDYDIEGITAGIDYRFNDTWVAGGALGYTRQDTDLNDEQGQVALHGWSVSGYSTHNFHENWYVDGVLTAGRNQYTLERRIDYTVPTPGGGSSHVQQRAVGTPDGDLFSAAFTFGGDFHRQSFTFSPYGQMVYARIGFDGYTEDMHSGIGSGLGLSVDSRNVTGLTGILGARTSWTNSADWGVWSPTLMLEWNHEFHDELDGVSAHFTHDPTRTTIEVGGEPVDRDYFRMGVGLSILMAHGRSGFFLYDRSFAQDRQTQENLSIGIRIEF